MTEKYARVGCARAYGIEEIVFCSKCGAVICRKCLYDHPEGVLCPGCFDGD